MHHRMPLVLAPDGLGRLAGRLAGGGRRRLAEQVAAAPGEFEYYPVSRYVNAPRNQGERCIEPATM